MIKQKGIVTLTVVSAIILISSFFSFAVMQMEINEVKKTQNLIVKANHKTHVKAAIDCAVAVFEQKNLDPTTLNISVFDECKIDPQKTSFTLTPFIKETRTSYWTLAAKHGFANASVIIAYGMSHFSAFQTAGSLEIIGGNNWESAPGKDIFIDGTDYVECSTITAGGTVTIDVQHSKADFRVHAPQGSKPCAPSHSTYIPKGSSAVTDGFALDIVTNKPNIDIFKDLFGMPKSEWKKVQDKFEIIIKTGSATASHQAEAVKNCGISIKKAIEAGNELIWVDGDCLLNGLSGTGTQSQSPFIVIKNGIIGINDSIGSFKGTLFQFTVDYPNENLANSWGPNITGSCKEGAMNLLCLQLITSWPTDSDKWATLPFFIYGSFITEGGYFIDIPNTISRINGTFELGYDENVENKPIFTGPPRILKGSYHDF